jgi:hypothetical protein
MLRKYNILFALLALLLITKTTYGQIRLNYQAGFTGSIIYYENFSKIPSLLRYEFEPESNYFFFPLLRPYAGFGLEYDFGKLSASCGALFKTFGASKNPYGWHNFTSAINSITPETFTFCSIPVEISYSIGKNWTIFTGVSMCWTLHKSRNYVQGNFMGMSNSVPLIDVDYSVNQYRHFNSTASLGVERKLNEHFGIRLNYEQLLFSPINQFGGRYDFEFKYTIQALNLGFVYRP